MTLSQYLGRGQLSRGRATISPTLDMLVSVPPFFNDPDGLDKEAVIRGLENMQAALSQIQGLEWVRPAANQSARDYVESLVLTAGARRSNHWMGTAKMGLVPTAADGGSSSAAAAVVDTDTRVLNTDNIFVVDASIFPGHVAANPSAAIVVAAEHAAERILALAPGSSAVSSFGGGGSPGRRGRTFQA